MSNLRVGAAKRCINPTEAMMPYPSFNRDNPFTAIFSDCNTRAIVIDNGTELAAVLNFDLGGVPEPAPLKARIEAETGIPKDHIFMSATHNHTGCDIVFSPKEEDQKKLAEYWTLVCEKAVEAVKAAKGVMRPARYGYGEGKSYVNGNRDMATELRTFTQGYEPEGYCDRTLSVMKFVDENGELICAIANYGMHATLGYFDVDVDGKTKVSGNIPGVAQDYAEARFGKDAIVLWQSAAAGDQNPQLYCLRDYEQNGFPSMARTIPGLQYNLITLMGKQHGVDICKAINSIDSYNKNMPMKFAETHIDLPSQRFPEGTDMQWINDITNHIYPLKEGERLPDPILTPEKKIPLYVQNAVLGDVAFVGIAAEIYALIGKACKEVSPYRKTMIVTHVDRSIGYIIDKTSVEHKCFEQFGPVQAGVCDELIAEGVRELFDEMME